MARSTGKTCHFLTILVDTNVLSAMMRWNQPSNAGSTHSRRNQSGQRQSLFSKSVSTWRQAAGAIDSVRPSSVPSTTSSAAACCRSTALRRKPRLQSLPGSGKSAGRSRSAKSRSLASPPRAKQPSPPVIPVILKTLASSSSILGTLSRRAVGILTQGNGSASDLVGRRPSDARRSDPCHSQGPLGASGARTEARMERKHETAGLTKDR
jgi:hypothetical protein